MAELFIGPAVLMGLLIGIYEAQLVHNDEGHIKGSMKHAMHTIPVTFIFVFIAMNVDYVVSLLPNYAFFKSAYFPHILRAVVGLVALGKIYGAGAIAGNVKGMHEKIGHVLIVVALIVATPYIFTIVEPMLKNIMPKSLSWLISVGGK
jgi:hypothetical protein